MNVRLAALRALGLAAGLLFLVPTAWGQDIRSTYQDARKDLQLGRLKEAKAKFEQILRVLPAGQAGMQALTLNEIGCVQRQLGEFEASKMTFAKSLEVRRNVPGVESRIHEARTYNNLGASHWNVGDYDQAGKAYKTSLKILEDLGNLSGKDAENRDVLEGTTYQNLANLQRSLTNYSQSEQYIEQSLKQLAPYQKEPAYRKLHAEFLDSQGQLYERTGKLASAEAAYLTGLKLLEANGQPEAIAHAQSSLAALYVLGNQPDKARPLLEACVGTLTDAMRRSPDQFQAVRTLAAAHLSLGYLELGQNRLDVAERQLVHGHNLLKKIDPNGQDMARCLSNFGMLHQTRGQFDQAKSYHERALALRQKVFPAGHAQIAVSQQNLALAYAGEGRWDLARETMNVARQTTRNYVARELPLLPRLQQLNFLVNESAPESHASALHASLAMALTGIKEPGMAETSANWVINGKGVGNEVLADQLQIERVSKNAGDDLAKLVALREDMAKLRASSAPEDDHARPQRLRELAQREQAIMRALGLQQDSGGWADVADVRRHVPANAVLIDIARHRTWDWRMDWPSGGGKVGWQKPKYVAWIIPPAGKGQVESIPLGDAEDIDKDVASLVGALDKAVPNNPKSTIRELGEEKADEELRKPLAKLTRVLLQPVLAKVGDAKQLIISPDASLWLVPWSALVLPNGHYLIEDYPVQLVGSSRDLLRKSSGLPLSAPLVFASPEYNLARDRVSDAAKKVFEREKIQPLALRSLTRVELGGTVFKALPHTEKEGRAIIEPLGTFTKQQPRILLGGDAVEHVFRSAVRPSALVLCTHGYFLEDQVLAQLNMKPPEDPLDRCGLALAGANHWNRAVDGNDDGVLTAREVLSVDLRGTKLVVLSACQTGLGKVHQGEGVVGMRQSFTLAGAQSVVSTLWVVPDLDSSLMMQDFFKNLAKGANRAEALRQAQLTRIAARRKFTESDSAHPFYWAAFTLTGQN